MFAILDRPTEPSPDTNRRLGVENYFLEAQQRHCRGRWAWKGVKGRLPQEQGCQSDLGAGFSSTASRHPHEWCANGLRSACTRLPADSLSLCSPGPLFCLSSHVPQECGSQSQCHGVWGIRAAAPSLCVAMLKPSICSLPFNVRHYGRVHVCVLSRLRLTHTLQGVCSSRCSFASVSP